MERHSEQYQAYCKERFERMEKMLEEKSKKVDEHDNDIATIHANYRHLNKSLEGVTKALWGVAASMITALFGFLLWYIQTL